MKETVEKERKSVEKQFQSFESRLRMSMSEMRTELKEAVTRFEDETTKQNMWFNVKFEGLAEKTVRKADNEKEKERWRFEMTAMMDEMTANTRRYLNMKEDYNRIVLSLESKLDSSQIQYFEDVLRRMPEKTEL